MRIKVMLKEPEIKGDLAYKDYEGVLVHRDESFLMVKIDRGNLRVTHFDNVQAVQRVFKGQLQPIGLENFRKLGV